VRRGRRRRATAEGAPTTSGGSVDDRAAGGDACVSHPAVSAQPRPHRPTGTSEK